MMAKATLFAFALTLAAGLGALAQGVPDYAAIVAAPDRSEADRTTDKRRDPVKLLAFTGVKHRHDRARHGRRRRLLDRADGARRRSRPARSTGRTPAIFATRDRAARGAQQDSGRAEHHRRWCGPSMTRCRRRRANRPRHLLLLLPRHDLPHGQPRRR